MAFVPHARAHPPRGGGLARAPWRGRGRQRTTPPSGGGTRPIPVTPRPMTAWRRSGRRRASFRPRRDPRPSDESRRRSLEGRWRLRAWRPAWSAGSHWCSVLLLGIALASRLRGQQLQIVRDRDWRDQGDRAARRLAARAGFRRAASRRVSRSSERLLTLSEGRARFIVAHEARPFIVRAASNEVVATGTIFDVSLIQDRLAVVLLEGSVEVRRRRGGRTRSTQGSRPAKGW